MTVLIARECCRTPRAAIFGASTASCQNGPNGTVVTRAAAEASPSASVRCTGIRRTGVSPAPAVLRRPVDATQGLVMPMIAQSVAGVRGGLAVRVVVLASKAEAARSCLCALLRARAATLAWDRPESALETTSVASLTANGEAGVSGAVAHAPAMAGSRHARVTLLALLIMVVPHVRPVTRSRSSLATPRHVERRHAVTEGGAAGTNGHPALSRVVAVSPSAAAGSLTWQTTVGKSQRA
mmetsp:Transcript_69357/g.125057  ORF Transcript_69357/g.125057 Transcript_69357/m.125057 type:complete len:239 (-) Transcript_69357:1000-1716(-)